MSGSGRKSQYRKSVTTNFLNDDRVPEGNERIVEVIGNRGDNTFEIEFGPDQKELAILPKKFNKLIWIKSGDFILVEDDRESVDSVDAIPVKNNTCVKEKYTIKHILSKANVKYLKSSGMWPDYLNKVHTDESQYLGQKTDITEDEYENIDDEYEEELQFDSRGNTIEKSI